MLIFVYDELLLKETQSLLGLKMKRICYATTRGKLYYMNDTKRKRLFLMKQKNRINIVFGAIYHIEDETEAITKLSAFYNYSKGFTKVDSNEDLFNFELINVTKVEINNAEEIKTQRYKKGKEYAVYSFMGNKDNELVKKSTNKGKYYGVGSISEPYKSLFYK